VMFKSVPEMEGEPSPEDYNEADNLYDMSELQRAQDKSIEKLDEVPETVYPDEIPEDGVYEVK
jgi:hypothetical protein